MSKMSQEEFDEIRKGAKIASCPNGEPHTFLERLKFINKGCIYLIGECENCHEFEWSWQDASDPPVKVSKEWKIL